jgi:hypothetical protein
MSLLDIMAGFENTVADNLGIAQAHTVHQVKDLVAAKQAEITHLQDMWRQYGAAWQSKDPTGAAAWKKAYDKALSDWASASASANKQIMAAFIPGGEDSTYAESDYQAVLAVGAQVLTLAQAWPSALLGTSYAGAGYTVPQPTAPDYHMSSMNAADEALKTVGTVGGELPDVSAPGSQNPLFGANAKSNWTKAAIIGGLALGGILILARR